MLLPYIIYLKIHYIKYYLQYIQSSLTFIVLSIIARKTEFFICMGSSSYPSPHTYEIPFYFRIFSVRQLITGGVFIIYALRYYLMLLQ